MQIGPRYEVEGPDDVGLGMMLTSHKRRINGKVFQFLHIKSSVTGSVTINAVELITYSDQRHNIYTKPK